VTALVALVSAASPATGSADQTPSPGFGYTRIAKEVVTTGEGPVLAGDQVLVGTTRRGRAVVQVFGLDGRLRQVLRLPHARRTITDMAASDQAVAVITTTIVALSDSLARRVPAAFGPLAGPLRAFPSQPSDVDVSGSLVVAFDYDEPDPVRVWDVNAPDAPARELALPGANLLTGVAGNYVAVLSGHPPRTQVIVFDLLGGGEAYRVRTRDSRAMRSARTGAWSCSRPPAGGSASSRQRSPSRRVTRSRRCRWTRRAWR
jgi:hypothetical protein